MESVHCIVGFGPAQVVAVAAAAAAEPEGVVLVAAAAMAGPAGGVAGPAGGRVHVHDSFVRVFVHVCVCGPASWSLRVCCVCVHVCLPVCVCSSVYTCMRACVRLCMIACLSCAYEHGSAPNCVFVQVWVHTRVPVCMGLWAQKCVVIGACAHT